MRFGKRHKSPLLWARRVRSQAHDPAFEPVEHAERDALIGSSDEDQAEEPDTMQRSPEPHGDVHPIEEPPFTMAPAPADATAGGPAAGDPTQQLLTALGRFQRLVVRAREGQADEQWAEDCMRQLLNAAEIAISQQWRDVVVALTETGRILHSYQRAERPGEAIGFLADSYEILCLMVGDLIVGQVRASVKAKWNERYQRALEELATSGVPLVSDDEEPLAPAEAPREPEPEADAPGEASPFDDPFAALDAGPEEPSPFEPADAAFEPAPPPEDDALPALDDLAGADEDAFGREPLPGDFEEQGIGGPGGPMKDLTAPLEPAEDLREEEEPYGEPEAAWEAAETAPEAGGAESSEDEPPFDEAAIDVEQAAAAEGLGEEDAAGGEAPGQPAAAEAGTDPVASPGAGEAVLAHAEETEDREAAEAGEAPPTEDEVPGIPAEVAARLDGVCDLLSQLETRADQAESLFEQMDDQLASLRGAAEEAGRRPAADLCSTMRQLCDAVSRTRPPYDEKFFELGYGFSGLYGEFFQEEADQEGLSTWAMESEVLMLSLDAAAASPPDRPSSAAEPSVGESDEEAARAEESAEDQPEGAVESDAPAEQPSGEDVPAAEEADKAVADAATEQAIEAGGETEAPDPEATPEAAAAAAGAERGQAPDVAALFARASEAMAAGRAGEAKLLTMKAAALIARAQSEEAARQVQAIEERLQRDAVLIEEAHHSVQTAEQEVQERENATAEGDGALEARRGETQAAVEAQTTVENELADIEARIRELEAQRDALRARRDEAEATCAEQRSAEEAAEAALAERRAEEQAARERLEEARQRVKELKLRRGDAETELEEARRLLERQEGSAAEIEASVNQIRSAEEMPEDAGEGGDLLF